jgi:hypothetical protein
MTPAMTRHPIIPLEKLKMRSVILATYTAIGAPDFSLLMVPLMRITRISA